MVQWLQLRAPNAEGMGLIPGHETKIIHAMPRGKQTTTRRNGIHGVLPTEEASLLSSYWLPPAILKEQYYYYLPFDQQGNWELEKLNMP